MNLHFQAIIKMEICVKISFYSHLFTFQVESPILSYIWVCYPHFGA